jgi:PAS domain S-box-containing protein
LEKELPNNKQLIMRSQEAVAHARSTVATSRQPVEGARIKSREPRLRVLNSRSTVVLPLEHVFLQYVTATAPIIGEEFFERAPDILAEAWGGTVFISELDGAGEGRIRTISSDREIDVPRALRDKPWIGDVPAATVYYPAGVGRFFPEESALSHAEVYLAVPLLDQRGGRLGYMGFIDWRVWSPAEAAEAESLLRLVAPRASAELDRRLLDERLNEDLDSLTAMVEHLKAAVITWHGDRDGCVVDYVTPAIEGITGYTPDEVRASPEHVAFAIAEALAASPSAGAATGGVIAFTRKDGRVARLEVTLTAADTDDGTLRRHRCVLREAPGSAATEASWSRDVLEKLPVATFVLEGEEVLLMNERAGAVTGSTPQDVLELSIATPDGEPSKDSTLRELATHLPRSRASKATVKLKPRRGSERVMELSSKPISLSDRTGVVVTSIDITDQQAAHRLLLDQSRLNQEILSSLPADFIALDAAGRVVSVNESANELVRQMVATAPIRPQFQPGEDYFEAWRGAANAGFEGAREAIYGIGAVLSHALPYFIKEYKTVNESGERLSFVIAATPLEGGGAVVAYSNMTPLKGPEWALAEIEARERELLENLPDQLARITINGDVVDVVMASKRSHMRPLFPSAAFHRNVLEVLGAEHATSLLKAVHDSTQYNVITHCSLVLQNDDDRSYEFRIAPLSAHEVLVAVRDLTAEQWTSRSQGEEDTRARAHIVRQNPYGLTFREVAVLELMAQGCSDKEIAAKLNVSVFTVYKHVSKVLHKMNVSSRTEASLRTVREHLFA